MSERCPVKKSHGGIKEGGGKGWGGQIKFG